MEGLGFPGGIELLIICGITVVPAMVVIALVLLVVRKSKGGVTSPSTIAAAWYVDPTGRHELRYWDGTQWTSNVSDGSSQSTDPM